MDFLVLERSTEAGAHCSIAGALLGKAGARLDEVKVRFPLVHVNLWDLQAEGKLVRIIAEQLIACVSSV